MEPQQRLCDCEVHVADPLRVAEQKVSGLLGSGWCSQNPPETNTLQTSYEIIKFPHDCFLQPKTSQLLDRPLHVDFFSLWTSFAGLLPPVRQLSFITQGSAPMPLPPRGLPGCPPPRVDHTALCHSLLALRAFVQLLVRVHLAPGTEHPMRLCLSSLTSVPGAGPSAL